MKRDRGYRWILSIALIMAMSMAVMMLTGCSGDDEDEDELVALTSDYAAYVTLPSDSDNGVEWEFEDQGDIFEYEDMFMIDDAYEGEGSGEEQEFYLYPKSGGTTTVTFTLDDGAEKTVYTYKVTVNDAMDDIVIDEASGDKDGEKVEAPEMTMVALY